MICYWTWIRTQIGFSKSDSDIRKYTNIFGFGTTQLDSTSCCVVLLPFPSSFFCSPQPLSNLLADPFDIVSLESKIESIFDKFCPFIKNHFSQDIIFVSRLTSSNCNALKTLQYVNGSLSPSTLCKFPY